MGLVERGLNTVTIKISSIYLWINFANGIDIYAQDY